MYDEGGNEKNDPLYLISLIEHKSDVDYDVAMQILKYMVCIWQDYAKEQERLQKHITNRKYFRYPPILPIVYYEGTSKWTAGGPEPHPEEHDAFHPPHHPRYAV